MTTPPAAVTSSCRACDRAPIARPGRLALEGYTLMHCPGCGQEWVDPQPDDATLARIYQQDYYDAWGLQDNAEASRTLKRAMFRRLLAPVAQRHGPEARLLDCGAALGYLMEEAAAAGLEPYGVELSAFGADAIAGRFGPDRVFRGPFEQAEFAGVDRDFFDVITMIDFLEHVRDPGAVLAKAFRLLRPGGTLVILTPDASSLSKRVMGPRLAALQGRAPVLLHPLEPPPLPGAGGLPGCPRGACHQDHEPTLRITPVEQVSASLIDSADHAGPSAQPAALAQGDVPDHLRRATGLRDQAETRRQPPMS